MDRWTILPFFDYISNNQLCAALRIEYFDLTYVSLSGANLAIFG